MVGRAVTPDSHGFTACERDAVYRAIAARRDVRSGFLPEPLPGDVLQRLLSASHCAPSVGLMQPTRFIVVRDRAVRQAVHRAFLAANQEALEAYAGERRDLYATLKLEGILEAPQNLCVLSEPQSQRGHGLGRQTMPETAIYSTVCAIQNLWLAARTEGIGVGWVSILAANRLREILSIPPDLVPVAYLCLGYVESFASGPVLEAAGWERRIPLDAVVSYDRYTDGRSDGGGGNPPADAGHEA
jgi:5,6-dimethylbenzimidazole synthase